MAAHFPAYISRNELRIVIASSDDLVSFENHGLMLVGYTCSAEMIEVEISDEDNSLDYDDPLDGFEVVEEPDGFKLPMPSQEMSAEALQFFAKAHAANWILVPEQGFRVQPTVSCIFNGNVEADVLLPDFDDLMDCLSDKD